MKRILILTGIIISGCTSIPREKIISDTENINKATEIHNKISTINFVDYDCVNNTNSLNKLLKKENLNVSDYEIIQKIFPDGEIKEIKCDLPKNTKKQLNKIETEIDDYCNDKYYDENFIVSTFLFPFRLTNTLSTIGTLGIIQIFPPHTCFSTYYNHEIRTFDNKNAMGVNCWAPGDDWNFDNCKAMMYKDIIFNKTSFTEVEMLRQKINYIKWYPEAFDYYFGRIPVGMGITKEKEWIRKPTKEELINGYSGTSVKSHSYEVIEPFNEGLSENCKNAVDNETNIGFDSGINYGECSEYDKAKIWKNICKNKEIFKKYGRYKDLGRVKTPETRETGYTMDKVCATSL